MALIARALELAQKYVDLTEPDVALIAVRSGDTAGRWWIAEGRRRSFARTYVVDMMRHETTEVIGGFGMSNEALIAEVKK
jgi:hypothetical protein